MDTSCSYTPHTHAILNMLVIYYTALYMHTHVLYTSLHYNNRVVYMYTMECANTGELPPYSGPKETIKEHFLRSACQQYFVSG